jgi:hypothetical protein
MVEWLTEDELERIWKEGVVAHSRYYLGICVGGLRKARRISVRITNITGEIRTENLPILSVEYYR